MGHPLFFDTIESIVLIDSLANILDAYDGGKYTLYYTNIVKAAGHSFPIVAGAFLMVREGLKHLYPNTPITRGKVEVFFEESLHVGKELCDSKDAKPKQWSNLPTNPSAIIPDASMMPLMQTMKSNNALQCSGKRGQRESFQTHKRLSLRLNSF